MSETYDIAIIGAGPAGYNCAIRAGQLGLKVVCIEERKTLGGTCLNIGCIPSKSLLHGTELYASAQLEFAHYGLTTGELSFDLTRMMAAKDEAVSGLTQGVAYLLKKNKVDIIYGKGTIECEGLINVTTESGSQHSVSTKNIVIATGSIPTSLPGVEIDEKFIATSTGALSFDSVPKKMVIIGGGVIGLELGSVWSRLGSEVTVVEYADRIIPGADNEIADAALAAFRSQGLKFITNCKVISVTRHESGVRLEYLNETSSESNKLLADRVIVAVGRKPFTEGLGLDSIDITLDSSGRIPADINYKVTDGVWVVGDCTAGPMLAHRAEEEGIAVAEKIAGKTELVEPTFIPSVVYTNPEIAWVGETEEQLKANDIAFNIGKFPMKANSRSRANNQKNGFVKILADSHTDLVLGVHIIAPNASELIAEACLALSMSASSEDIARTCHAHPTVSEATRQAAMAIEGWAMQI